MNKVTQQGSYRLFLIMWLGSFINAIGTGLTVFALSVYFYQVTESATMTSLVTLVGMVPRVLLLPYAGALADRYDRRILMVMGDGISGLGTLIILLSFIYFDANLYLILLGLLVSSIFSTFTFPAFKASISDILSPEDFMRSASMIQLNDVAGYLICPSLAGLMISFWPIEIIFIMDILTLIVTVACTLIVKKHLIHQNRSLDDSENPSGLKEGIKYLRAHQAVLKLILYMTLLTFFLGMIQCLVTPLILSITNSETLGYVLSIAASGMLVMSLYLSMKPIKTHFRLALAIALALTGLMMVGIGVSRSIPMMTVFAFMLFACLAVANGSLDYLIRINVDNAYLGRVMGLAGNISQIGYILSFLSAGILADYIFTPFMETTSFIVDFLRKVLGSIPGRGMALVIAISGVLMIVAAYVFIRDKSMGELREVHNSKMDQ